MRPTRRGRFVAWAAKRRLPFLTVMLLPVLFRDDPNALVRVCALAIAATGISIVTGLGGQITLGHAALMSAGALTSAGLSLQAGIPVPIAWMLATVFAAALGFVMGLPSLRLRGQYLALATLGFGVIQYRVANELSRFTGGELGIAGIPAATSPIATAVLGTGMVAAALIGAGIFHGSRAGLRLRAVRDQEQGAAACGVSVLAAKLGAFVVSAALAGAAGALHAHSESFVTTLDFDPAKSFVLILAVILGGLRSPYGGALGVLAVYGPTELAPSAFAWLERYRVAVWSIPALYVVFRRPDGLTGLVAATVHRLRPRARFWFDDSSGDLGALPRHDGLVLRTHGLSKRFGGLTALDAVDLEVRPGTIHALVGPNGSGKTTLVDCITGHTRPDGGLVELLGRDATYDPAHRTARTGVARTFQNIAVFDSLTVGENLRVASPDRNARQAARRLAGLTDVRMFQPADALSYGERKRLELARAIAMRPALLVLDEPAAGRNEPEIHELAGTLKGLRDDGATILLVEHHMPLVAAVADEVTVLDEGRVIARGTPAQIRRDPLVVEAYLGLRPEMLHG